MPVIKSVEEIKAKIAKTGKNCEGELRRAEAYEADVPIPDDIKYVEGLGWVRLLPIGLNETVYTWRYCFYNTNYQPRGNKIVGNDMRGRSRDWCIPYSKVPGFNAKVIPVKMKESYYAKNLWNVIYFRTYEEAEQAMKAWATQYETDTTFEEVVERCNKDVEPIEV